MGRGGGEQNGNEGGGATKREGGMRSFTSRILDMLKGGTKSFGVVFTW